jgi:two-component system response regulator YesN
MVQAEKPDILLIDIRMPFLSGLQLIERINEVWRDCMIIVVTGHDEFEYAQKALQLRVFEYLLKPVPQDVLAAVLGRARDELQRLRREVQFLALARQQLDRHMPLLREQHLRDWINGRLSRTETREQSAFLGIDVGARPGMAVIHVVERPLAPDGGERGRRLLLMTVRRVAEECFAALRPLWVFQDEHDNIVVISSGSGGADWVGALERTVQEVTGALGHVLLAAQRTVPEGDDAVAETYEALTAEVRGRGGHGGHVQLAQDYVDAHYAEPDLSLEEVASAVEVSPGYLSRLLRQETGFAFVEYLTRVRIAKAMQLMSDPAVRIYEAAEAVGYDSQHYFSRAFKKVFGCPPAEFRKKGVGE